MDLADLLENYIAAGFDPARFWNITPRLYVLEMKGAARRMSDRRAEIWLTAALTRAEKLPEFDQFVHGKTQPHARLAEWQNAWDKVDRALSANRKGSR